MSVCSEPRRLAHGDIDQATQEATRCCPVPMLAEHRVQEIAVPVNRPIEVTPGASHLDVGLIEIPGAAGLAAAAGPQSFADQRGELELPGSYGRMCDRISSLAEQFGDITKAELIAKSPEDGQEDNVSGELEIVKVRARALIVAATEAS